MSSARDKIFDLVARQNGAYKTPMWTEEDKQYVDEDVDSLIAIVREAMLSDAARDAALSAIVGFAGEGTAIKIDRDDMWNGMYAAVAAVGLEASDDS